MSKEEYVDRLMGLAKQLGIKDASENKIISNFYANYDFYNSILEKAMSDGYISVDNKVELYKYRASIITDDFKIIKQDDKVSKNDVQILTEILRIVDDMRKNEDKFPSIV
ncbi:MAG: hypothetical protein INQ03_02795 [Candidatus Heimdallarchaeota archaeon]|nr:hypothetical protein [Candidatus Heimdallarchaeota archaeon]